MKFKFAIIWFVVQISETMGLNTYYMDVNCGRKLNTANSGISAFKVSLTESSQYRRGMVCKLVVQARPGHRLMFHFSSLDIKFNRYSIFGNTYSRCVDWIELHDGPSNSSPFIKGLTSGLCGLARNDNTFYNSTNEDVTIYFHSSDIYRSTGNTGFTLVFTEFHKGACLPSEFRCPRTRRCISQSDTCNKHNPCGDFTDCTKKKSQKSTQDGLDVPTIIGVIISVGFLLILLILVIAVMKRRSLRPTERRCRPRNSISLISNGDMAQLRLPTYEEVTGGAVGLYEATPPPPYAEQDPNKSTGNRTGETSPSSTEENKFIFMTNGNGQ